ncbi:hypothetical protein AB0D07_15420 [Streptomyces globisporus]|uniref:hypothetical protein n=1 Tax=Streptomyces globisporus TaxID=1908 RepID=UPI0034605008
MLRPAARRTGGPAGPHRGGPSPEEDTPETAVARAHVTQPVTELGWSTVLELGDLSPVHRSLVASVATLVRLGYPCDIGYLTRQARIMEQAAVHDLDEMEAYKSEAEQVEKAVASAVLYEPAADVPAAAGPE